MKNHFLISDNEKDRIRVLHESYLHSPGTGKLIMEVGGATYKALTKYLSKESAEALSKKYADDALKAMDGLFTTMGKNILQGKTGSYIASASGNQIPISILQKIIDKKIAGESVDQYLRYLPRELADGSPFRSVFTDKVKALVPKTAGAVATTTKLSGKYFDTPTMKKLADSGEINTGAITNWGGSADAYSKVITNAIRNNDYSMISRGGFEKLGIPNFREFLKTGRDQSKTMRLMDDMFSFAFK